MEPLYAVWMSGPQTRVSLMRTRARRPTRHIDNLVSMADTPFRPRRRFDIRFKNNEPIAVFLLIQPG
jgi:hypothetical protein